MLLILRREFRAHLHATGFWVLLALTQLLVAGLLFAQLEAYQAISAELVAARSTLGVTDLVLVPTFNSLGVMLLLAVPLLGMHALAEERRSGHLAVLLASPVTLPRLLLGKWLGNALAALTILGAAVLVPLSLSGATGTDPARLLLATLGLVLLVLLAASVTLACSAFSRHPNAALAAAIGGLLLLWLLDSLLPPGSDGYWLALNPHLQTLFSGSLQASDIGYFLLLSLGALSLAGLRLSIDRRARLTGRWRLAFLICLLGAGLLSTGPLLQRLPWSLYEVGDARLSVALQQTLAALQGPLVITAYAPELPLLRAQIDKLVQPLKRHYPELELRYVDPLKQPQQARQLGIERHGELLIEGMGRRQQVRHPNRQSIEAALGRIARRGSPWVVTLKGHGESLPDDPGGAGLGAFREMLEAQGYQVIGIDPLGLARLPDNTGLVLVAGSRADYPRTVEKLLRDHLAGGGRLLWLHEGANSGLLQRLSGIQTLPGQVLDPALASDPDSPAGAVSVNDFSPRLLPRPPARHALLLGATALRPPETADWQVIATLRGSAAAWNETGPSLDKARRDPLRGERQGPLGLVIALQRGEARLVAAGDSDFITDAALGLGGNRGLVLGLVNWLTENRLATAESADDIAIGWGETPIALLAGLHLLVLPCAYLLTGLRMRHRREKS